VGHEGKYKIAREDVDGWALARRPKLMLAQLRAQYQTLDAGDGRILQVDGTAYRELLRSVIGAQADHRADLLVFPEYAWPVAAAVDARDELARQLAPGRACVLPFEHATLRDVEALVHVLPVPSRVRDEVLGELEAALPVADHDVGIVNLCFVVIRIGEQLVAYPQLKLRPAGLEEEKPLGRWRFAAGNTRRILVGGSYSLAVAICFDFIAIDPDTNTRLRNHMVERVNLVVVPECNPAPLHPLYGRGAVGLFDSDAWADHSGFVAFANVAQGSVLPPYPKRPFFGFSRVVGDLGETSAPIEHGFSVMEDGVFAHSAPDSLAALSPPPERLSFHDLSWVVCRPQESLLCVSVPLAGTTPDPARGRTDSSITVSRRLPSVVPPWRPIRAMPNRRAVFEAQRIGDTSQHRVPTDLVPPDGLVGVEALEATFEDALAQPLPIWVYGRGGLGKSALVATALAMRPWCRALWVDMESVGTTREQLCETLLSLFGMVRALELDVDQQWRLVLRELARKPTVLVLDSYEKARAHTPLPTELLAQPWPSRLVVTARDLPPQQDSFCTIEVRSGFSESDARKLVARISGISEIDLEPAAIEAARGSPLACTWVGAMLKLGAIAPQAFASGEGDPLRRIFESCLANTRPHHEQLLSALCWVPEPLLDQDLATICELAPPLVADAMTLLHQRALVVREGSGATTTNRVRHPFVRQFLRVPDLLDVCTSWVTGILDRHGGDARWEEYPQLSRYWPNVRYVLEQLVAKQDARFLALWRRVDYFLWTSGRWADRIAMGEHAARLASLDPAARHHLVHATYDSIGETRYFRDGDLRAVLESVQIAVGLLSTMTGTARDVQLGFLAYYASRWLRNEWPAAARAAACCARELARATDYVLLEGLAVHSLAHLAEPEAKIGEFVNARTLFAAAKDKEMMAIADKNIGKVYLVRCEWGEALRQFELALDGLRDLHLPTYEAIVAGDHAIALAQLGDIEEAERELDDAIAITRAIGSAFRIKELEARRRQLAAIASQRRLQ
jgi:predicted amidohydrolase/tetratricopeptide (TPR) repeat protein